MNGMENREIKRHDRNRKLIYFGMTVLFYLTVFAAGSIVYLFANLLIGIHPYVSLIIFGLLFFFDTVLTKRFMVSQWVRNFIVTF